MPSLLKQIAYFPLEVFGYVGHYEAYSYSVVKDLGDWTVRRYEPAVAAQVRGGNDEDSMFIQLATYIGVFGNPNNIASGEDCPEAVAMTVPVVTSTPIAMTVPVVNTGAGQKESMQFILPSKYRTAAEAPKPTSPNVQLLDVPAKYAAVLRFYGRCSSNEDAETKYEELASLITEAGLKAAGPFELHRFNPPFTIPALRANEIVVPIAEETLPAAGIDKNACS